MATVWCLCLFCRTLKRIGDRFIEGSPTWVNMSQQLFNQVKCPSFKNSTLFLFYEMKENAVELDKNDISEAFDNNKKLSDFKTEFCACVKFMKIYTNEKCANWTVLWNWTNAFDAQASANCYILCAEFCKFQNVNTADLFFLKKWIKKSDC